jgi:hypothetical protein
MPLSEVAAHQTMARTGLCLSAGEGNMHAAVEYLVAGLPVVSTPSSGGRDAFFHPDHTTIAAPKPDEIARAVREFCRRPPDPQEIRGKVMAIVNSYRDAFAGAVDLMLDEAGVRQNRQPAASIVAHMSHDLWYGQHESTVGAVLAMPGYEPIPAMVGETA